MAASTRVATAQKGTEMPYDIVSAEEGRVLLHKLASLREGLIKQISNGEPPLFRDGSECDRAMMRLAEVQACITAVKEHLSGSQQ